MEVLDIDRQETIEYLKDKGFFLYNGGSIGANNKNYYCYFDGQKRIGNESPSICIDAETGVIYLRTPSTYFLREIPDILYIMILDKKVTYSGDLYDYLKNYV